MVKFKGNNQRFLKLVWLDTSHEEGVALLQGRHQKVQGLLELRRQSYRLPLVAFLAEHLYILSKQRLEELVFCRGEENLNGITFRYSTV